jgi:hypothetical protein
MPNKIYKMCIGPVDKADMLVCSLARLERVENNDHDRQIQFRFFK